MNQINFLKFQSCGVSSCVRQLQIPQWTEDSTSLGIEAYNFGLGKKIDSESIERTCRYARFGTCPFKKKAS